MRKLVIAFLSLTLFASCSIKSLPLKGHYIETPFRVQSEKTREEVWANIIDFFGQKGIGIKIIDKSSWLIISDAYSMPFTTENSKGILIDPSAFLVVSKITTSGGGGQKRSFNGAPGNSNNSSNGISYTTNVSAEWNVILKEQQGKAIININIVNPRYIPLGGYQRVEFAAGECFSTGVFEKTLSEILK